MTNADLDIYYNRKKATRQRAVCKIASISEVGTSDPGASGMPAQHFFTLSLIGQNVREGSEVKRITNGGFKTTKTIFELTHPDAYQVVSEWKAEHMDGVAYDQEVEGFMVRVPTKRDFIRQARERDKDGNLIPNAKLVDMKDRTTGKVITASSMEFFILLEGESEDGELRRRGTQLEKLGKWLAAPKRADDDKEPDEPVI